MSTREIKALRGATTVERDEPAAIQSAVAELLKEIMVRNEAGRSDLVSIILTSTPDLSSEYPAAGARAIGLTDVALLSAVEVAVPRGPRRCIRVLVHLYTDRAPADLRHVYLRGAAELRRDL